VKQKELSPPELTGSEIKFSVRLEIDPVFFQKFGTPTEFLHKRLQLFKIQNEIPKLLKVPGLFDSEILNH
jgi:hypothetical protein